MVLCVADKPGEGGSSFPSLQQSQTSLEAGERGREREREGESHSIRRLLWIQLCVSGCILSPTTFLTAFLPFLLSLCAFLSPSLPLCAFLPPLMTIAAWNDSSSQFGTSRWGASPLCRPLHNMYISITDYSCNFSAWR